LSLKSKKAYINQNKVVFIKLMKTTSTTAVKLTSVILLALAARVATVDVNPCDNPYTTMLKADSDADTVALALASPVEYALTNGICYTEWNSYKTCCDHTKVLTVANKRFNG
jgi:hypothetical protein